MAISLLSESPVRLLNYKKSGSTVGFGLLKPGREAGTFIWKIVGRSGRKSLRW